MRIAVTGAYGQLGAELCRMIGDDAMPSDVDSLDLTDAAAVSQTLLGQRPDAIVNCAAYTDVDRAESEPDKCRAINVGAVENLIEVSTTLDCPLVQISTDYVFGGDSQRDTPYTETDPPAPLGVYARSKFDGERAAAKHGKHIIVRTCGLYARPQDDRCKNFVKTMLALAAEGKHLRVVDDQCFSPSYVPHVARAILFLLGHPDSSPAPWGIYNVTNTGGTTCYNFAAEIFRLAGVEASLEPITTAEYGAAAARPAYSVLDTAAYHRLGGPPMPDWQTALAEYIDAWKKL